VRHALLAVAAAAAAFSPAWSASANGRFPASNQLVLAPADPSLVVVRTTFGILVSHDAGSTWRWLCEGALGLPATSTEDPAVAVTADGTIVVGTSLGLEVSHDTGCNWAFAGGALAGRLVADVAVRPDQPHAIVALTTTYAPDAGADGGPGYASQVYESTDDGASWSPTGAPLDPSVVTTTIDVAASDPHRLYVAGVRPAVGAASAPLLLVWTDSTGRWTEHALPPLADEVTDYIAGVDPTDADVVYVRSQGVADSVTQSRLFVTTDAGQSVRVALTLTSPMLGFALSPDGSNVYAGSAADGLLVAPRAAVATPGAFRQVSPIHVACLAARPGEVWACSDEASKPAGFLVGVSRDDGATFTPELHLGGIAGALVCPAGAAAAQCSGAPFQGLCDTLGGCLLGDGGASDAGATPPSPRKTGSCACGAGGRLAAGAPMSALLPAAALLRRRLTKRRHGPGARQKT
jgi:photosystem II stability/assembly factor-like uncharacterized protein